MVAESHQTHNIPENKPSESKSRSGRLKDDGLYGSNGFFFQNRYVLKTVNIFDL